MRVLSWMYSHIHLELTSADPEMLLQDMAFSGIEISAVQKISDLTVILTIKRRYYSNFVRQCEKHGANHRIIHRSGIFWLGVSIIRRPYLILGLTLMLFFCLVLPTRILFVRVSGNTSIPAGKILYAAQDCGIGFGASRQAVRSEKVKNTLLSSIPELEWVGVNTSGCVAEILVRERSEPEITKLRHEVSHIIAATDGYILSMTVTSGNPLCAPGQQVKKGQVLVSGYTDCGIFIQATRSEAEIIAQTNHHLDVITPVQGLIRSKETRRKRKFSLLIGKKRINLFKGSGILDSSCGRIYKQKYAALPGGFQLPLALCVEEYIFYDLTPARVSSEVNLSSFAHHYLTQHMTAGSILKREEQITSGKGILRLVGNYTCQEMIGKVKHEQIGELHG